MISGDVPKHLVVAARTGFLSVVNKKKSYPWQRVANILNMDAKSIDLVDLGAAPMPTQSKGGVTIQDFIEKTKTVTPTDWDITVWISENAVQDDKTGELDGKVRGAGDNFQRHINNRVFTVLNAGDGSTYGLCYDGLNFISASHVDKGAHYQTLQSNLNDLALTPTNFNTVWVAGQSLRNDQGEFLEHGYDLLVCNAVNMETASNITGNPKRAGTGNNDNNPYNGLVEYITAPQFDTNAWHLIASNESVKPLILAMKKAPYLQSAWFDPTAPDGGRYYFKFYGRYEVHYGLWTLVLQGKS